MANAFFNINNNAVVAHTNRLEKLHKSALPLAIRGTLNNAAFDVKQTTMPKSAINSFKSRKKNFFKANSRVDQAKGFNVKSMSAIVGFTSGKLKGGSNFAVKDLEQQERGGIIKGKTFIPNRTGKEKIGNINRTVPKKAQPKEVFGGKKVIRLQNVRGVNWGQRAIKASFRAGIGGFVKTSRKGKRGVIWQVKSIKRVKKGSGNSSFKRKDVLYQTKTGKISVKRKGFMSKASSESANKLSDFFKKQAEMQIQRLK